MSCSPPHPRPPLARLRRCEMRRDKFVSRVQALHKVGRVQQGRFGAKMLVQLCNDGPVTITLDSPSAAPAAAAAAKATPTVDGASDGVASSASKQPRPAASPPPLAASSVGHDARSSCPPSTLSAAGVPSPHVEARPLEASSSEALPSSEPVPHARQRPALELVCLVAGVAAAAACAGFMAGSTRPRK